MPLSLRKFLGFRSFVSGMAPRSNSRTKAAPCASVTPEITRVLGRFVSGTAGID